MRRSRTSTPQVIKGAIAILIIFTLYIIFFNPNLSSNVLDVIRPIVYIGEAIILFASLYLINSINLGESDLGIWGIWILSGIILVFGLIFLFFSGFIPKYTGVIALFGIVLMVIGAFMAFRARRRRGQFVYVR